MIEGGCRCGACRYTIDLPALPPVYACHCHICQRWSGSAFSLQALIPEAALQVDGPVVLYEKVTEDRTSTQRLCGACHSRLYNTNTRRPGVAVVRAGTLDRSEDLECRAHIFTDYRQRWFALDLALPHWGEAPDMTEFVAVLS
ncbi:MAG: GFA family protein [Pseudomonadota bacterium]